MAQVAIGNAANNQICVLTAVGDLTAAADKTFGVGLYDIEETSVLDSQAAGYSDAYSWNLTTHVMDVDIIKARVDRMNQFKTLRKAKWVSGGLPENPSNEIIGLYTGAPKTDLESLRDMISVEQTVLDTKTTIAELEAYTPSYLV